MTHSIPPGFVPLDQHGLTGVVADIADIAVQIEQYHHALGWDGLPYLYSIHRRDDGPIPCANGNYDIQRSVLGAQLHPRLELRAIAQALRHDPDLRGGFFGPDAPVAHALCHEAWAAPGTLDEIDPATMRYSGPHPADRVGGAEIRISTAVIGAHLILVIRQRGHEPLINHVSGDDHDGAGRRWLGAMLDLLREIHRHSRT